MITDVLASQPSTSALVESAGGHFWDVFLVGLVIAAALFYLYRKLWAKRGVCTDCTSGGPSCSGCQPGEINFDMDTPLKKPKTENE